MDDTIIGLTSSLIAREGKGEGFHINNSTSVHAMRMKASFQKGELSCQLHFRITTIEAFEEDETCMQ